MIIDKHLNGIINIYATNKHNVFINRRYVGYSIKEARQAFRQDLKESEAGNV
jgi:hypothetical protein